MAANDLDERALKYLDLHVHLRGTLQPTTARRLARRHGATISEAFLDEQDNYLWSDFGSFLECYDEVTRTVQSAKDLEEVALEYMEAGARDGLAYVEFMLSPPDLERHGVPYAEQLAALDNARDAGRALGVESSLVVTAVRQLGPAAAIEAARLAGSRDSDLVVGFGLAGDERRYSISDFAPAFDIARAEGLRLTAHAGEHLPGETVLSAIDQLGLDRVGHGVRAADSPELVACVAATGVALEICLTSNLALAIYRDLEAHPLRQLAEAGCRIVLGTDDPGFFQTTAAQEYALADKVLGETAASKISDTAISAAFCSDELKARIRAVVRPCETPEPLTRRL